MSEFSLHIGQRIKRLRTEKMMTQSELAGSEITRNMLSRIENGAALPSLSTVLYLADRLRVPAGYLLADSRDELIYHKAAQMVNIKSAYLSGNLKICRDMCRNLSDQRDDELNLILSETCLGLGIESFAKGSLHGACAYFDEALRVADHTIYQTRHVRAVAATYFRYLQRLSPTLTSDVIDEGEESTHAAMHHPFSRYVLATELCDRKNYEEAKALLADLAEDNPLRLHVTAREEISQGRFTEAYEHLHRALTNAYAIEEPLLYFVFCDLEAVCRELDDYKHAYEYSLDKVALLQKLLSEEAI